MMKTEAYHGRLPSGDMDGGGSAGLKLITHPFTKLKRRLNHKENDEDEDDEDDDDDGGDDDDDSVTHKLEIDFNREDVVDDDDDDDDGAGGGYDDDDDDDDDDYLQPRVDIKAPCFIKGQINSGTKGNLHSSFTNNNKNNTITTTTTTTTTTTSSSSTTTTTTADTVTTTTAATTGSIGSSNNLSNIPNGGNFFNAHPNINSNNSTNNNNNNNNNNANNNNNNNNANNNNNNNANNNNNNNANNNNIINNNNNVNNKLNVDYNVVNNANCNISNNNNNNNISNNNTTVDLISNNNSNVISNNNSNNDEDSKLLRSQGDMIYSLLSILGTHNKDDMSRSLHAMSLSPESCVAMRQSGCLPLLIHLLHNSDPDLNHFNIRSRSSAALRNIINVHCEDQRGRQESRVLRLLEQVRDYCDHLRASALYTACSSSVVLDDIGYFQGYLVDVQHPSGAVTVLMKLTFDEEHRHAICTLGGIQALAELLQLQQELFGHTLDPESITMRRYTCMALTNLTFGDGTNKALLCSMPGPLRSLVIQLESPSEDLCQVAASVLRNLSWHADTASKKYLRSAGAVEMLTRSILVVKKEATLKSLLSALWNFSSHCPENKEDICAIRGALELLVWSLNFKSPSKTLAVVENGGGVLRNVSSHVATRSDYRIILRQHGCLPTLLKHLRSPSLTVVSNACGTLWNLSAHCLEDQKILCNLGAVSMLKSLVHSKHRMISMGSAAALRNLMSSPVFNLHNDFCVSPYSSFSSNKMLQIDACLTLDADERPGLYVRKQRAFQKELESHCFTETCENMDSPVGSPTANSNYFDLHNTTPCISSLTFTRKSRPKPGNKYSINIPPTKPPSYPINLNDVICHSDSESTRANVSKVNNYALKNNLSLENEGLDSVYIDAENFYSPGIFLSCHETGAMGNQDNAADFYQSPFSVHNNRNHLYTNNYNSGCANGITDEATSRPSAYGDLMGNNINSNIDNLEEGMIRVTVGNEGELVNDGGRVLGGNIYQEQLHEISELISNHNVNDYSNTQASKMLADYDSDLVYQPRKLGCSAKDNSIEIKPPPKSRIPCLTASKKRFLNQKSSIPQINIEFVQKTSSASVNKMDITIKEQQRNGDNREICTKTEEKFDSPKRTIKSFLKQPISYSSAQLKETKSSTSSDVGIESTNICKMLDTENVFFDGEIDQFKSKDALKDSSKKNVLFISESLENSTCDLSNSHANKSCMSLEHERALQENVNLVLSVLERTSLTESNLSNDVLLLEHETISLISDDDLIDEFLSTNVWTNTNNLETPSKNLQETNTFLLSNNQHVIKTINLDDFNDFSRKLNVNKETSVGLNDETFSNEQNEEAKKLPSRPRIVKPGSASSFQNNKSEEIKENTNQPKVIKGKRKALYSNKPKITVEKSESRPQSNSTKSNSSILKKEVQDTERKNRPTNPDTQKNFSKTRQSTPSNNRAVSSKIEKVLAQSKNASARPQSAVIKNASFPSSTIEEGNKQTKLKSYSLPPNQKPPTANDIKQLNSKGNKTKPLLNKQDTFIKQSKSNSSDTNKITLSSSKEMDSKDDRPLSSKRTVTTPKHMQQRGIKKPPIKSSSPLSSLSSNEKLTSVQSSSSLIKIPIITKSGSNYSVTSNRSVNSMSGRVLPKPVNTSVVKQTITKPSLAIAKEISGDDKFSMSSKLVKSSTYDKLEEYFQEGSKLNISPVRDKKESKISMQNMVETEKKALDNISSKYPNQILKVQMLGNKKPLRDNLNLNIDKKKETIKRVSPSAKKQSSVENNERDSKHQVQSEIIILDPTLDKGKNVFVSPIKSKLFNPSSFKDEKIDQVTKDSQKMSTNNTTDEDKMKHKSHKGFPFWKKHSVKSNNETESEIVNKQQLKSPSLEVNTHSKKSQKNKVSPKPESPIKRRVFGWFKKNVESHTLIAEKNQSLNIDPDLEDINSKNAAQLDTTTIDDVLANDNNNLLILETLINNLDLKNGNNDTSLKSTTIQPFNCINNNTDNYIDTTSLPPEQYSHLSSKLTKTDLLLARHRRSRLNSDSRSSMAMSIDSLKVNSIDSFQHTDRSFSDNRSEVTGRDDDSVNFSDNSHML